MSWVHYLHTGASGIAARLAKFSALWGIDPASMLRVGTTPWSFEKELMSNGHVGGRMRHSVKYWNGQQHTHSPNTWSAHFNVSVDREKVLGRVMQWPLL